MGRVGRATGEWQQSPAFEPFSGPAGLTYQPGLDGLRGLAVAVVVAFHLGLGGVTGGYLGVSMFFTLSGVLIGSVILNEITFTGAFSLRRFWVRRARRLLPPALVTLAAISVARPMTATLDATSGPDVVASAFNVANWQFLAEGASYADLFGGPSAVLHFWSLAIEEQFYLVAGLLATLVATRTRRPARTVGLAAAAIASLSFVVPFVVGYSVDRVYYGTDTRAGELMIGVAFAAVVASGSRRRVLLANARPLAALAAVALTATLMLWHTATPGTESLRGGLLPLTASLSVLTIVGALLPVGPVAVIARFALLRWLGRVSYAVYLIHWPVIVVANQITTSRSIVRSIVLVALSLALAQLSSMFVERPVRSQRVSVRHLVVAAAAALASIGVASAFDGRTTESADLLVRLSAEDSPQPTGADPDAAPTADVPRVGLFGDSVAFSLLLALGDAPAEPQFVRAASDVHIGCGIAVSPSPPPDHPGLCDNTAERYALTAIDGAVDIAIMISCQWELVAQPIPGSSDGANVVIGDAEFDRFIRIQYDLVADRLADAGVDRVLWMRCPYLSLITGVDGLSPEVLASRDPSRTDRLNSIIVEVAADREDVEVLAFDDWVNKRVDDPTIRPDGSHYEYRRPNDAAGAFVEMVNAAITAG